MDRAAQRQQTVERQVARRGIADPGVLEAMTAGSREAFVAPGMEEFAYQDTPLPIGEKQTISQPYIVAMMAQLAELKAGENREATAGPSQEAAFRYLDKVDLEAAGAARERYGCLSPWQRDPATCGRAVFSRGYESCEEEITQMLVDIMQRRLDYLGHDGALNLEAERSAALIRSAEKSYRAIYYHGAESRNLRDRHRFEPLERVLEERGPHARAVVWAHNSHIGDARATEMGIARERWGEQARLVGFGTDSGTVAAATDWGGAMEIKRVRPSHRLSHQRFMSEAGAGDGFLLDFARQEAEGAREALGDPRLERAIGVIYRPETERQSHYFEASLSRQFDAYLWFDRARAVTPIESRRVEGAPDTYPFGL